MTTYSLNRAYVEITDVCNLSCSFCPGTGRAKRFMTMEEYETVLQKLSGVTRYLYLHVMGEPLLHPLLGDFLRDGGERGFYLHVTTNGTLLPQKKDVLLSAPSLRKISVSLHSFEANGKEDLASYLNGVTDFYRDLTANKKETYLALRLWNEGGRNQKNEEIIARLSEILRVDVAALPEKNGSKKIKPNLFLESASRFDWPSLGAENQAVTFCHGLTRQIGVLCDGTVVPCCLDSEGTIALGNLFTDSLTDVLQNPRAEEIRRGFACRHPSEELCRKCGYATRFR